MGLRSSTSDSMGSAYYSVKKGGKACARSLFDDVRSPPESMINAKF